MRGRERGLKRGGLVRPRKQLQCVARTNQRATGYGACRRLSGHGLARARPWRGGSDRIHQLRGKRRDFRRPLVRCSAHQMVVVYEPACQQGRDGLLEPLIQQRGDFLSKVGCVVQSRQLKVAEGAYRCGSQKLPRRIKASHATPPEETATVNTLTGTVIESNRIIGRGHRGLWKNCG